jgi:hypothetical protein
MRSVADTLKAEQREVLAALTPEERVRLALRLGSRDLEAFRLAQNPPLDPAAAVRELRRRRHVGRRPSRCAQELDG